MEFIHILIIIIVSTICVGSIMFLAYKTDKNFSLSKGKISVEGLQGKKKSKHRTCIHATEIIQLFYEQRKVQDEIFYEKHIGIMKEQMAYTELKVNEGQALLLKHYLKLLKELKGAKDGIASSEEFLYYTDVIKDLGRELLNWSRHLMRENHLADKSEIEFQNYVEEKTTYLSNKASEYLNARYTPYGDKHPSRERIYDFNQEIIPELKEIVKNTLRKARQIAVEKQELIQNKLLSVDEKFSQLFS